MSDQANESRAKEIKAELFKMQGEQKKIQDQLEMHNIILAQNKVGMKDSLVDKDDFPRSDIDVWAVRQSRSAIVRLENDSERLVNQMQSKLEELHSLAKSNS